MNASDLHVIAVVSNPVRYHSRHRLYQDFAHHVESSGATLHTVEAAYGERPHAVTSAEHPRHLQLRTRHELWHKENLVNLGIARLPADWKYVAWVDADVSFSRPDWALETLHQLQHHAVVQMWTRSLDLGPDHRPFGEAKSFAACHLEDLAVGNNGYGYWHSGYAWAARRGAIDTLGGLMDFCALGSADYFMAWALRGRGELTAKLHHNAQHKAGQPFYSQGYLDAIATWERRAHALRGNLGAVEGTLLHHWHGKKRQRGYNSREAILIGQAFDPARDLKRDWQGLWQLADTGEARSLALRDQFRGYFRSRNEDSVDLN